MKPWALLRPGLLVADIGHNRVGTVQAVSRDSFEVALVTGKRIELTMEAVFNVTDHGVTLICHYSNLAAYRKVR